jgi:hypothetical protein
MMVDVVLIAYHLADTLLGLPLDCAMPLISSKFVSLLLVTAVLVTV